MKTLEIFKEKLAAGNSVFGPFMKTGDAALVECVGCTGFDFVILDMEHGPVDFFSLQNLIRAAEGVGIIPIVRTCDSSEVSIGKALDLGAKGIQVPQVQSVEEAKRIIKVAKFFPDGERGVCRFVRAANYSSIPRDDYFRQANENLVILQIEGKHVLDQLDQILKVKGLDILFIGPYDLSQSFGIPGQISHPLVIEAIRKIVEQAKQMGVITGVFCDTFEAAALWHKVGIQYLSYSVDMGIFTEACKVIVDKLKTNCSDNSIN